MSLNTFFGFKKKQLQTFNEEGERIVATVIKTFPLEVTQIKTNSKDKYSALKIRVNNQDKKRKKCTFKEIKLEKEPENIKLGDKIQTKDIFKIGDLIQVSGITKGKGFAGVVKRWGFAGGPKTHGQSDRERAPGSIGMRTTPGRVWKGKKMPGHMGVKTKTIKGLKVFKLEEEKNELWVTGLIPGNIGGMVKISKQ